MEPDGRIGLRRPASRTWATALDRSAFGEAWCGARMGSAAGATRTESIQVAYDTNP